MYTLRTNQIVLRFSSLGFLFYISLLSYCDSYFLVYWNSWHMPFRLHFFFIRFLHHIVFIYFNLVHYILIRFLIFRLINHLIILLGRPIRFSFTLLLLFLFFFFFLLLLLLILFSFFLLLIQVLFFFLLLWLPLLVVLVKFPLKQILVFLGCGSFSYNFIVVLNFLFLLLL